MFASWFAICQLISRAKSNKTSIWLTNWPENRFVRHSEKNGLIRAPHLTTTPLPSIGLIQKLVGSLGGWRVDADPDRHIVVPFSTRMKIASRSVCDDGSIYLLTTKSSDCSSMSAAWRAQVHEIEVIGVALDWSCRDDRVAERRDLSRRQRCLHLPGRIGRYTMITWLDDAEEKNSNWRFRRPGWLMVIEHEMRECDLRCLAVER